MRRALLASVLLALGACAGDPSAGPAEIGVSGLDEDAFGRVVHPVLVEACGSTACHGASPRGLRVYGESALRLDGGVGATSPAEVRATYVSVVALQPEQLAAFLATSPRRNEDAQRLLVLAKPLALERHRGGVSLRRGEPAELCIRSWLLGEVDAAACAR